MDVVALARQGWTVSQIAAELGRHPVTVGKWLKNGGPPAKREVDPALLVIDERWAVRIAEILKANSNLLGTSVDRMLRAEGFEGSYPTLMRHLREVRGVRRHVQAVSVPIETGPGEEFQFDWSDCCAWGRAWGLGELHCFGAILCWSRHRHWWFAPSLDRCHTFEGLVRFFEDAGGVAGIGRTDRMGALGVTRAGRFRFNPEALAFASAHGCVFKACATRDAKRKGKVERPFRELKSSFLEEITAIGAPSSIPELNIRAAAWLASEIHTRPHRVTGVAPAVRLESERQLLAALPRIRCCASPDPLRHRPDRAPPSRRPGPPARGRRRRLLRATGSGRNRGRGSVARRRRGAPDPGARLRRGHSRSGSAGISAGVGPRPPQGS